MEETEAETKWKMQKPNGRNKNRNGRGRIKNSSLVNWQNKLLESVAMAWPLISSDIMSLLGKSARPHNAGLIKDGKDHRTKYIDLKN